jgi:transmembrane sensor
VSEKDLSQASEAAAMWLARMLRSDASLYQAEFETWLEADDAHKLAYERLREQYQRSLVLAHSRSPAENTEITKRRRWLIPVGFGIGAVLAGLAAAAVMLLSLSAAFTTLIRPTNGSPSGEAAVLATSDRSAFQLASPTGHIRTVRLPDGSQVTLDTGAALTVAYNGTRRFLTLSAGRARFDVVHERRPFVVAAGTGDITAHGTIFDVQIMGGGKVQVALLRGAIGVRVRDPRTNQTTHRELAAHQKTDFGATGFVAAIRVLTSRAADWPSGVVDVDAMTLSDLIEQANRYTDTPIEIADPSLASLQVSGRFQINRPELVVQNLIDLFGLTVDRSQEGRILLKKKIQTATIPA